MGKKKPRGIPLQPPKTDAVPGLEKGTKEALRKAMERLIDEKGVKD